MLLRVKFPYIKIVIELQDLILTRMTTFIKSKGGEKIWRNLKLRQMNRQNKIYVEFYTQHLNLKSYHIKSQDININNLSYDFASMLSLKPTSWPPTSLYIEKSFAPMGALTLLRPIPTKYYTCRVLLTFLTLHKISIKTQKTCCGLEAK